MANIQSERLNWTQITPLLVKAKEVRVIKQKIDEKGALTTDKKKWHLDRVEWKFKPNHESFSAIFIKDEDDNEEKFDFLGDAFKFYYDSLNKTIYGEIQITESGFIVTYRYLLEFYGTQQINNRDFLVNSGSACYSAGINHITAL